MKIPASSTENSLNTTQDLDICIKEVKKTDINCCN